MSNLSKDYLLKLSPEERRKILLQLKEKANESNSTQELNTQYNNSFVCEAEKRMWYLQQLEPHSDAYHVKFKLNVSGEFDEELFSDCINTLTTIHPILKSNYKLSNGDLKRILKKNDNNVLTHISLNKNQTNSHIETLSNAQFNLEKDNLFNVFLYKHSSTSYTIFFNIHHIIIDGWSIGILLKTLESLYNKENIDTKENSNYFKFIHTEQHTNLNEKIDLFCKKEPHYTSNINTLNFDKHNQTKHYFIYKITETHLKKISTLCQNFLLTPYMLYMGILQLALYQTTNQKNSTLGTVFANRADITQKETIGLFVNTLPFSFKIDLEQSISDFFKTIKNELMSLFENQNIPFNLIVNRYNSIYPNENNKPLFNILFAYQNEPIPDITFSKTTTSLEKIITKNCPADLNIEIYEKQTHHELLFQLNKKTVSSDTIEKLKENFFQLLNINLEKKDILISELVKKDSKEPSLILDKFNQTDKKFPNATYIQDLIFKNKKFDLKNTAVIFKNNKLSYQELFEKSNALTNYINQFDTQSDIIAILIEPCFEMIITLISILDSGHAFLPISTTEPPEKIKFKLNETKPSIIITKKQYCNIIPEHCNHIKHIFVDTFFKTPINYEKRTKEKTNLAYIMYTSGTTGTPKGVMINHKSVINFLQDMSFRFKFTKKDSFLALTKLTFDISILEIFLPLTNNGTIILCEETEKKDIDKLITKINTYKPTFIQATPITWKMLFQKKWSPKLKTTFLCGGDTLTKDLAKLLLETKQPTYNMYGPTETTIWSSCSKLISTNITIGVPISNTKIFILNDQLEPVPIDTEGGIYISGKGLSPGYLNNKKLTDNVFISNPFEPKEKMYKTGDIGKWTQNGEIIYLGRNDNQIKIRGIRIESEEIENHLKSHKAIKDALVISSNNTIEKKLIAFITLNNYSIINNIHQTLSSHLLNHITSELLPSDYIFLHDFPLTTNNKIDRKELIKKYNFLEERNKSYTHQIVNETEKKLYKIWKQLLPNTETSQDIFFNIGGHSLLLLTLQNNIEKTFNLSLTLTELFKHNSIELQAKLIEKIKKSNNRQFNNQQKNIVIFPDVFGTSDYAKYIIPSLKNNYTTNVLNQLELINDTNKQFRIENLRDFYSNQIQEQSEHIFMGYSFGGLTALDIALNNKNIKINAIVLIDPPFKNSSTSELFLNMPNEDIISYVLNNSNKNNDINNILENEALKKFVTTIKKNEMLYENKYLNNWINLIKNNLNIIKNYDPEHFQKIKIPALFIKPSESLNLKENNYQQFFSNKFILREIQTTHSKIFNSNQREKTNKIILEFINNFK